MTNSKVELYLILKKKPAMAGFIKRIVLLVRQNMSYFVTAGNGFMNGSRIGNYGQYANPFGQIWATITCSNSD